MFVLKYQVAEMNIYSEILWTIVVMVLFYADTLMTSDFEFGGIYALGTNVFDGTDVDLRGQILLGYFILVLVEVVSYFATVFVLQSRLLELSLKVHDHSTRRGLDAEKYL